MNKTFIIVSIILIGLLGFIIYKQNIIFHNQNDIQQSFVEQKRLNDDIVRSFEKYATRNDINELIKNDNLNINEITKDLNQLGAKINSYNQISVISNGQVASNISSSSINPNNLQLTIPDQFGYLHNKQNLDLFEKFQDANVPIGSTSFSAWQDKPWSFNILARKYNVSTVIGTDENGRNYSYNKFEIDVNGKQYPVRIDKSTITQIFPHSSFTFWNPRLFATGGGSVDISHPAGSANVGGVVGIMSYGKLKTLPDISVLQLGAVYQSQSKNVAVIINPINFNLHNMLKTDMVQNTYLGPSLQLDTSSNIYGGLNISVGF